MAVMGRRGWVVIYVTSKGGAVGIYDGDSGDLVAVVGVTLGVTHAVLGTMDDFATLSSIIRICDAALSNEGGDDG
jgi:hypothetical protein